MNRTFLIAAALWVAPGVFAGDGKKGAKSLFVDQTSTTTIITETPAATTVKQPTRRTTRIPKPTPTTQVKPVPSTGREVSALKYYFELLSPDGEVSHVTSERVFHSGERVLLHVKASFDGDVAVYQVLPNNDLVPLFPDLRIANGSGRIARNVDTILPSPTSFFRFDNQPGIERLLLKLTPQTALSPAIHSPAPMLAARFEEVATTAGSKGLLVETEDTASYVARINEAGKPIEPITVEILLRHQ